MALEERIIAMNTQVDYIKENGSLPPSKSDIAEQIEVLSRERKSLGEKASRIRKRLRRNPDNLDNETELKETVAESDALKARISELKQAG